jgi:hypothetical protein
MNLTSPLHPYFQSSSILAEILSCSKRTHSFLSSQSILQVNFSKTDSSVIILPLSIPIHFKCLPWLWGSYYCLPYLTVWMHGLWCDSPPWLLPSPPFPCLHFKYLTVLPASRADCSFPERVLLSSLGWPWTHDPPASTSQVLKLQGCTTMFSSDSILYHFW